MKLSRLLLVTFTLAFFTLAISTATAGSMGNGGIQRQQLVIEAIDPAAGTVEFKSQINQSVHSYKIDGATRAVIGTTKGTVDQIKVGMRVYNYAVGTGQPAKDGDTLTVIGVNPPLPAPK